MRNLRLLDAYRDGSAGDETCGAFTVPSITDRRPLRVIASTGFGWDHVSVSRKNRCPNWPEMSQIKHLFFEDNETAVQMHVAVAEHINLHPYCLHLWRDQTTPIRLPPSILVGPAAGDQSAREEAR